MTIMNKASSIVISYLLSPIKSLLPSYRNQLIDLLCKSMDWFLFESNTDI